MTLLGQITVPASTVDKLTVLGHALVELAQELQTFSNTKTRVKSPKIPKDQAWYWTPEWQAMEREADEDLARGNYKEFNSVEEMFAYLDSEA